jgi:hypothetical protein
MQLKCQEILKANGGSIENNRTTNLATISLGHT